MKRLILLFFMVAMLLAACTSEQSDADTAVAPAEQVLAVEARATETQTPLPTDPPQATAEPVSEVPATEPTGELEPTVAAIQPAILTPPPLPTEEAAVAAVQVISGQTAEGAYFLGDPNAPVTVIDYSDFL